jgi:tetratricopeptide (TPR) repeat protein
MTLRFRSASAATAALVLGMSLAPAGCGKYSLGALKAQKAYKEAVDFYKAQDWRQAAQQYEYAIQQNPNKVEAYFYLGNSYDNMYKPSRVGEAENDAYIQKAIDNYTKAAERDPNAQMKKLALEYLVAAYGAEKLNDPEKAEPIVQRMIQMEPNEPGNYFLLMSIYENSGRYDEAEVAAQKAKEVRPNDAGVYSTISGFYNRQGDFTKTIDALEKAAELAPSDPQGFELVATFYWEKAQKDARLTTAQRKEYIQKGIDYTDKALALNPEYSEALTYKNILLRMKGNEETDLAKRALLYKEADVLREKAMELNRRKATGAR